MPQPEQVVITDARLSASEDLERRQRRYMWTMLIRVICFVAMFFLPGWWKVAALAGAVFLPAAAVLLANDQDRRAPAPPRPEPAPIDHPALPSAEIIRGEVDDQP